MTRRSRQPLKDRQPSLLLVSCHTMPNVTPGSLRVRWMSSELAKLGWAVTILSGTPGAVAPPGVRVEAVTAWAGPTRPARLRTLWNDYAVPDRHVLWRGKLGAAARRIAEETGADVILSTSPPHSTHLPLQRLRSRTRVAWVTDFRDPWTAPKRSRRGRFSVPLQRRMERGVLLSSDAVIANTEGNRAALLAAFPRLDGSRVHVVPNAYEPLDPSGRTPHDDATPDITYVGEVYRGMLDRFLKAMVALFAQRPRLSIYGHVDPRERASIASAGLGALVEYHGSVSYEESLAAMQRARSLLLLLPDGKDWASCVPSKLYPYLAAERPVVAFVPVDGDAARIVRATGTGVVLDGNDAAGLAEFLDRVRRGGAWTERREEVIAQYGAPAVAARLDGILRRVCEEVAGW